MGALPFLAGQIWAVSLTPSQIQMLSNLPIFDLMLRSLQILQDFLPILVASSNILHCHIQ
jgi:hypothetical protein